MVEDVGDNTVLGDHGNDTHLALATRAAGDVDVEHVLEPSHPAHRRPGRWVIIGFLGPGAWRA